MGSKSIYVKPEHELVFKAAEDWCNRNDWTMSSLISGLLQEFLSTLDYKGEQPNRKQMSGFAEMDLALADQIELVRAALDVRLKAVEAEVKKALWHLGLQDKDQG